MARPSKKTKALVEAICAKLAEGVPLTEICNAKGMPAPRTVRDWIGSDPEVSAAIARAREDGFDAIAAECLEIADDSRNDWMERMAANGDPIAIQFNGEHVQRSRLRVETRLKLLAKWDPKRYGDKVQQEVSGPNGGPIETAVTVVERRIVRPADRNG